jgi:hypothetical protein
VTTRAGRLKPVNQQRLETRSGTTRHLLALLIGVLSALVLIASGAPPAAAQNAVGPQPVFSILSVGPHDTAAPDNLGVRGPPQLRQASATGVAAETAARAPGVIRACELKLPGVPKGVIGVPVRTGKGLDYAIPRGTPELDPQVASIRVMDPPEPSNTAHAFHWG